MNASLAAHLLPVCVFAKPAVPGAVKTRLIPALGAERAASLASAFLEDTWHALGEIPWAARVLATTDCHGHPELGDLSRDAVWDQGDGDLGARLERVLVRALRHAPAVFAMGADTPGLPRDLLEEARVALQDHDAVLGPTSDGGFYVLGLRRFPVALLHEVPWSASTTYARTRERLIQCGMSVAAIAPWFDVDEGTDLDRLIDLLNRGALVAPRTSSWIARSARV